jgi:hypothetical protein
MLRELLAAAATAGLAKKAWDRYHDKRRPAFPNDITEVIARPEAVAAAAGRKPSATAGKRREGPAS